jgi:hypothetical protein
MKRITPKELIEAAKKHGEASEQEMEVGDLQVLVFAMWKLMTADQRAILIEDPEIKDVLQWLKE